MGVKLVLLVTVTNHTEAPVWSTNHMSGLIWLTSHFPLLLIIYEGASSRDKSVARVCFKTKLPRVHWHLLAVK